MPWKGPLTHVRGPFRYPPERLDMSILNGGGPLVLMLVAAIFIAIVRRARG